MNWGFAKFVLGVLSVSSFSLGFASSVKRVYYPEHAKYCKSQTNSNLYIQAATFSHQSNAERYQKLLQSRISYQVKISHKKKFYVVLIGPINSALELKKTANSLLKLLTQPIKGIKNKNRAQPRNLKYGINKAQNHQKTHSTYSTYRKPSPKQSNPVIISNETKWDFTSNLSSGANWFIAVGAGGAFPTPKSNISINNGSFFPAPYDKDLYTVRQTSSALVNVVAGRRWERNSVWIPAYSLGVFYQRNFLNAVRGTVSQYSLPEYTNYNYDWNLSSDIVLASAKVNIYSQSCFSPYITSAIGAAFNQSSYRESALFSVTPRVSPNFSGNNSQFTYNVGAGIDFQASNNCIISIGYLYQSLGHLSGKGKGTWAETSFGLGTYGLNEVLASITYLFDK